jgi:Uma2 family endonuclease
MALAQPVSLLTPAEYLRIERDAPHRSEYFAGVMFAMAGGSPRHILIKTNLVGELRSRLKGRPCTAYDSDLRFRVSASGLYTYADASVICGELEGDDADPNTVLSPTLIGEVLSDTTEAYDRGKKFDHYRNLASLKEYLLVWQDAPTVERFSRNPDDTWTLTVVTGLDGVVELPAIGVALSLAEVFDKVEFAANAPGSANGVGEAPR